MSIPDEAIEAAWKVMEPRFLGMNRERCRDSLILALRAALPHLPGGDEYHTLDELYEYRLLYNAAAANNWHREGIPVIKSWRHSDGEKCFGGGWFIVTVQLPTGQISNHYPEDDWHLFDVPVVDCAPQWDGHTPRLASLRLRRYLEGFTEEITEVDQ